MEQLGFDPALSTAEPERGPPPPGKTVKKQLAKAHAKQYRKARKGERRGRADTGKARSAPPGGGKPKGGRK
jgi:23S rRNA pseudouridine955/2504/2580 synthase